VGARSNTLFELIQEQNELGFVVKDWLTEDIGPGSTGLLFETNANT
jgi:hypothetical protein